MTSGQHSSTNRVRHVKLQEPATSTSRPVALPFFVLSCFGVSICFFFAQWHHLPRTAYQDKHLQNNMFHVCAYAQSSTMVGPWMLCGNGWGRGGRYHGWAMDALRERMGSGWTLSWLGHGCSAGTDGVGVDVIMVGPWMLCGNGWGRGGRYHGWAMDALRERMESGWTLSWLGHGCSAGTDGVGVDVIMVGPWMLCGNGWGRGGRCHGWAMDALRERMGSGWTLSWLGHGCSAGTHGVGVDVNMVGPWMLCGNGWGRGGRYHGWAMDALRERMGSGWTLSWLGHGCSAGTDGVGVDVIMVGPWMLCRNGWGRGGRCHGWAMDALREWMGSGWTLSWLGHGCSAGTHGVGVDVNMVGPWMLCGNGWGRGGRYHGWAMDALRERMGSGWTLHVMVGPWMLCGNGWGRGGRYHGWAMDALRERIGSGWTLSWLGHGCSAGTDGVGVDVIMVGPSSQERSRRRVSMNQAKKTRVFSMSEA